MSAARHCPTHLLDRLNTLQSYVMGLAVRCEQERAFAEEIASAAESAARARTGRSRILVERAILQHRELAQRLYAASRGRPPVRQDGYAASSALLL